MSNLCLLFWGLVAGASTVVSIAVSYALDNWGALAILWARIPAFWKAVIYAALTILVSVGGWAAGTLLIPCPNWPNNYDILYLVIMAALGWFAGGKRHEAAKA